MKINNRKNEYNACKDIITDGHSDPDDGLFNQRERG